MAWRHLRILRRVACGAFAAIAAVTLFAIARSASAQTNLLPSIFLSPDKPFFWYWVKVCSEDNDFSTRRRCFTAKDSYKGGELIANVGILEADGGLKKFFGLSTPDAIILQHGVRLAVDRDKPVVPPFISCVQPSEQPERCAKHYYEVGPDFISRMKTGQVLTVAATKKNGRHVNLQIDLKEFARAYDGPPTEQNSESQKPYRDDRVLPQQLRR